MTCKENAVQNIRNTWHRSHSEQVYVKNAHKENYVKLQPCFEENKYLIDQYSDSGF